MEEMRVVTVAENVDNGKVPVDLDHALSVAGIGWYNIKYSLALSLFLIAAIVEPVGYSFILPAAICDLNMTDSTRGFIASVPYIGIVLTSYPWGYLVDTRGRKRVVIYASLAAGTLSMLSAFMPDVISFTICKFLTSLCIACPAAVPYTFIGEILPQKYRDVTLSITNALQITGSALVPCQAREPHIDAINPCSVRTRRLPIKSCGTLLSFLVLAWGILPLNFRADFGSYDFRPWRLLVILYASVFIIAAILLSFGPESPKYLISQRKHDEALQVLQTIYAGNKRKSPKEYPVKRLKMDTSEKQEISFVKSLKIQTVPLLKPPFLKWMALNGFLLFGIFAVLNGLYMWVPDILNRVLTGSGAGLTACEVIAQRLNETGTSGECDDSIDEITYLINSVANLSCAVIAVAVSSTVKIVGKKNLLIIIYCLIGTFCILINFITEDMIFAVLLSSFPIMGLAIGPVNAYAVEIFPTHLRGMAVGLAMMLGRTGSVLGTNLAGLMLNAACEATFYSFGGLLIFCAALSLLLPRSRSVDVKKKTINTRL